VKVGLLARRLAHSAGIPVSPLEKISAQRLPFAELLGIEFLTAEANRVVAKMSVRADLCTVGGIAHGGAIMSLADTVGAVATIINLPEGARGTATIESKTNFIGPAPAGSTVIATATAVHRGRRTQVWSTKVESEDGRLVAVVTQTQMVL
jgi:1,4-dihydroxy-2-naphthoyl-CoA hydrolase